MRALLPLLVLAPLPAAVIPAAAQERPALRQADDAYYTGAQEALARRLAAKPNTRKAKNVILFVGDGMDGTTVTAGRIYDGQDRGVDGEANELSFETLPHVALAKTYNTDAQVADSSGTMSAMVTGIKTRIGALSVAPDAEDCTNPVATLGELAEAAGMATGVVSTARLTHATPAAVYAHSPNRNWENDRQLPDGAGCKDIARQLIEFPYGDGIDLAMGGGRANFLPRETADPEDAAATGARGDGRDLTEEWAGKSSAHAFVYDRKGFDAIDPASDPRVLALFERSHMEYELDRESDAGGEPSLAEMTTKAIEILKRDRDGFFLMVEAARIDHAHHAGNAARALKDVQALSEAVAAATAATDDADTLIIVTADHGHTMTIQGYPARGNPILGLVRGVGEEGGDAEAPTNAADGKAYTTLSYTNGPRSPFYRADGPVVRPELTEEAATDPDFRQQSAIPAGSETHGGQDVTIYAGGPQAYLFDGVVEQNYIFHVIERALDLKKRAKAE